MKKHDSISISVIKRLPRYYRFLGMLHDNKVTRISSRELSEIMGLPPRKFGKTLTRSVVLGNKATATTLNSYMAKLEKF